MSAGGISHARDNDCVSRSNVCVGLVLFVDEFMAFRDISVLDAISTGLRAVKSTKLGMCVLRSGACASVMNMNI